MPTNKYPVPQIRSHREIIGYSAGKNKDAELVKAAWLTVRKDIRDICIFHTDRGSEFKNEDIDKILEIGNIERSLSRPGKPVDNAVCESMYDIVKTEFIFEESFADLADLQTKLSAWVWWYNNERLHSSLGYKSPVESRKSCEIGATNEKIANKKEASGMIVGGMPCLCRYLAYCESHPVSCRVSASKPLPSGRMRWLPLLRYSGNCSVSSIRSWRAMTCGGMATA